MLIKNLEAYQQQASSSRNHQDINSNGIRIGLSAKLANPTPEQALAEKLRRDQQLIADLRKSAAKRAKQAEKKKRLAHNEAKPYGPRGPAHKIAP